MFSGSASMGKGGRLSESQSLSSQVGFFAGCSHETPNAVGPLYESIGRQFSCQLLPNWFDHVVLMCRTRDVPYCT
jgi:hypothetical protein